MIKDDNNDVIVYENKRISLIELEDMIKNGITPPDIKEIDDMPKEEWVTKDNLEEIIDKENKIELKRPIKPWEKNVSNNIINNSNL